MLLFIASPAPARCHLSKVTPRSSVSLILNAYGADARAERSYTLIHLFVLISLLSKIPIAQLWSFERTTLQGVGEVVAALQEFAFEFLAFDEGEAIGLFVGGECPGVDKGLTHTVGKFLFDGLL